jgi:hypothetical protein
MFLDNQMLKLCLENGTLADWQDGTTKCLKYTVDAPKIQMSFEDPTRFTLLYDHDFKATLELKALSQQSKDLFALSLKALSAQKFMTNQKIIDALSEHARPPQSDLA